MVALGNLSPHRRPVVVWPLLLLSQGSDGIGLERTRAPAGTCLTARRGVWVHEESALGGVNGKGGLREEAFFWLPGFTLPRKEPAYNSRHLCLYLRLGQHEKAAETQSTVGKALLSREEGVVQ